MKYRKLRIAWSVAWGVVCLLLVALWVRSYSWLDAVYVAQWHSALSMQGRLHFDRGMTMPASFTTVQHISTKSLTIKSTLVHPEIKILVTQTTPTPAPMQISRGVPTLIPLVLFIAIAASPWMHWPTRFSLRTLLVGMTAAAIGLGWIVYAMRI